jgi:hypothetical protein
MFIPLFPNLRQSAHTIERMKAPQETTFQRAGFREQLVLYKIYQQKEKRPPSREVAQTG